MPGRSLLFVAILGLCVAGPYLLLGEKSPLKATSEEGGASVWNRWLAEFQTSDDGTPPADTGYTRAVSRQTTELPPSPRKDAQAERVAGPRGMPMMQLLNFDITPDFLYQNWTRVTSNLSPLDLQGLRVAVVTGTEPHDFAGTASYYFNADQRLMRISLIGYTGEPEPLAGLLQTYYGMRRYPALGKGLFLGFHEASPVAMLNITTQSPTGGIQGAGQYRVELELNRPEKDAVLSEAMLRELRRLNQSPELELVIARALGEEEPKAEAKPEGDPGESAKP